MEAAVGRGVDVKTGGAEELDGFGAGGVVAADGEDFGRVAEDARAAAEVLQFVFVGHLLDAGPGGDVALMDEAVEELGGGFNHLDAGLHAEGFAFALGSAV